MTKIEIVHVDPETGLSEKKQNLELLNSKNTTVVQPAPSSTLPKVQNEKLDDEVERDIIHLDPEDAAKFAPQSSHQ